MEMVTIQNALSGVLLDAVLAMAGLLGAWAVHYIRLAVAKVRAQTARLEDDSARILLDTALDDVQRLAELSVGAMEQTTAKALREQVKNGTAKREELLALGEQVFREVKEKIAPESRAVIARSLGSFDSYLTTCIENAVLRVKQADPFPPLPDAILVSEDAV